MNPKGFIGLPALLAIIVVLAAAMGGTAWYLTHQPAPQPQVPIYQPATTTPQIAATTNNAKPFAVIDAASLVTSSTTPTITGTCGNVAGAMALVIVPSGFPLSQTQLPGISKEMFDSHTGFQDVTDHGGEFDDNCSTATVGLSKLPDGTFSTHFNNPSLQSGEYTIGIYTYQNVYTDQGYQGTTGLTLLTSATLKVSGNDSTTSVPGMSQYTDSDFGFSFWYPSGWKITGDYDVRDVSTFPGGEIMNILHITDDSGDTFTIDEVSQVSGSQGIVTHEHLDDRTIYFDTQTHTWMTRVDTPPGSPGTPQPADVSVNTMGGLHMITGGPLTTIIPLSARNFLFVFGPNSSGPYLDPTPLIKTIVATDPSVATPVSSAQQEAAIQKEKAAYAGGQSFEAISGTTFMLGVGQSATDGAGGLTITLKSIDSGLPAVEVVSASSTLEAELASTANHLGLPLDLYGPGSVGYGPSYLSWSAKLGNMEWPDTNSPTGIVTIAVSSIDATAQTVTFTIGTTPFPPDSG